MLRRVVALASRGRASYAAGDMRVLSALHVRSQLPSRSMPAWFLPSPHAFFARLHSTHGGDGHPPAAGSSGEEPAQIGKIDKPTYQLTFTCKVCDHRSSHLVSKQAYHSGTVLIQCPSCKNRHLIADHLNVFGQGKKTLEDILAEKGAGEKVTKSTIDLNKVGDIEWEGPGEKPEFVNEVKKLD